MKLFQIDYRRLVLLLLPTFLRRFRIYAFLTAMTFGVEELHRQFTRSRDTNLLRLRRNGQVCYLRALLNDELDPVQRRITLEDASQPGEWVMIYDENASYQTLIQSEPGNGGNPISNSNFQSGSNSGTDSVSDRGLVRGFGSVRGSGSGADSVSGFRSASVPVHILYDEGAILENTSFFTVNVPWNVKMKDSTNRLRSLLNEYKLLSKTYIINYANE